MTPDEPGMYVFDAATGRALRWTGSAWVPAFDESRRADLDRLERERARWRDSDPQTR